ncbi:DnaD domain-containing protein [Streptococcus cuniculipharyngis]|uniref:DnaD domain-containing protein n=1 Tax=Streptococcus cuniculipharyngis TaxID=1562651 RepID=A0A5C5SAV9_9STRE|nr:DnaD domain-containing protein [Streptococcus cuniculipharyngis]TWS98017.1 DnaD domain-containing protein [Streptococcus cuniculipharyngis]
MSILEHYQKGNLVLPASLLLNYKDIFSSADDFLVWQFFFLQNTTRHELAPSQIANALGKSIEAINGSITNLINQELLAIRSISVNGLEETIFDTSLALDKLEKLEGQQHNLLTSLPQEKDKDLSKVLPDLLKDFEQAGWVLTPFQLEDMQKWIQEDQLEPVLIREALRESVYSNTRNWRYLSKILQNWKKDGLSTLADIEQMRQGREQIKPETVDALDDDFFAAANDLWGRR